jgi:hypothetical protein
VSVHASNASCQQSGQLASPHACRHPPASRTHPSPALPPRTLAAGRSRPDRPARGRDSTRSPPRRTAAGQSGARPRPASPPRRSGRAHPAAPTGEEGSVCGRDGVGRGTGCRGWAYWGKWCRLAAHITLPLSRQAAPMPRRPPGCPLFPSIIFHAGAGTTPPTPASNGVWGGGGKVHRVDALG